MVLSLFVVSNINTTKTCTVGRTVVAPAPRTSDMHDSRISIQRRYKTPPGRDGTRDRIRAAIPPIGPGLCRIMQTDFRESTFPRTRVNKGKRARAVVPALSCRWSGGFP